MQFITHLEKNKDNPNLKGVCGLTRCLETARLLQRRMRGQRKYGKRVGQSARWIGLLRSVAFKYASEVLPEFVCSEHLMRISDS